MSETREHANFAYVHRAFAETEFGKALAPKVRWDRYKPETFSNEHWQELLGVDANNLGHLQLMGNMARGFGRHMAVSKPGYFEPEEPAILEVAGYIHDWGESIPSVGDINYLLKTAEDEAHEQAEFEANLAHFFNGGEADVEMLIRRALDEVIFTKDSKLGQAFNAIERVGYVRTGLRAAKHVIDGTAPGCEENLRWLAVDVLSNNISKLIDYSNTYPPIKDYLTGQESLISAAFLASTTETFANYGAADRQRERLLAFEENFMDWRQWKIRADLGL